MSPPKDFDEFANCNYKNHKQHEQNIKELCVKTSIISLSDFYNGYQQEVKDINAEITPSTDQPTVTDFADIFKAFEVYPQNLQKPKRPLTQQQQRMNSTVARDMTMQLMTNSREQSPSSTSLQNILQTAGELPSASEIYKDFRKFQQKLAQFLSETQQQENTQMYEKKLEQLCAFSKQLEKLRPTTKDAKQAFTDEEETKLHAILAYLEELSYIRENQEIFAGNGDSATITAGQSARTESFLYLITYLLNTVSNM